MLWPQCYSSAAVCWVGAVPLLPLLSPSPKHSSVARPCEVLILGMSPLCLALLVLGWGSGCSHARRSLPAPSSVRSLLWGPSWATTTTCGGSSRDTGFAASRCLRVMGVNWCNFGKGRCCFVAPCGDFQRLRLLCCFFSFSLLFSSASLSELTAVLCTRFPILECTSEHSSSSLGHLEPFPAWTLLAAQSITCSRREITENMGR